MAKGKKKKISVFKIILFFALIAVFYFYKTPIMDVFTQIKDDLDTKGTNSQGKKVEYGIIENIDSDLSAVFCPGSLCQDYYLNMFEGADESIYCAFYEFDDEELAKKLIDVNKSGIRVEMVVDNRYLEEEPLLMLMDENMSIYSDEERGTRFDNYMHNKFCVIDEEELIMGSANPTENGFYHNNNNILKFKSEKLAKNYLNEFNQLKSGVFGENKLSVLEYNKIRMNYKGNEYVISNYFCPQDSCANKILEELNKAEKEILFSTFVITEDSIENVLELKALENVTVKGVIESRMWNTKGSRAAELKEALNIKRDSNPKTMHHKFFVIDEKIVITGSMNPSKSGNTYNDENILIIENEALARQFKQEFEAIWV
jgi:phosphatidylserine/phosphatidylglycerophosphate/cardiolipin synthase-like enzyme